MKSKRFYMPDGTKRTYYCGDDQTWDEIIREKILPYWQNYCEGNWLSANHEEIYAPERRVKWFLDSLAYALVEGGDGVESEYREKKHKANEIPVSECPDTLSDYLYADRTPPVGEGTESFERLVEQVSELLPQRAPSKRYRDRNAKTTVFQRIGQIAKELPDSERTWCIVDATDHFVYKGTRYLIPDEMRIKYKEDPQMDRILAVETPNTLRFYDQTVQAMYVAV